MSNESSQSPAHLYFRPALLLFLVFMTLQLLSGALLYYWKIGFNPAHMIEYYFGSVQMLAIFPEAQDRFLQARSFDGMIKVTLGHFLAYAVLVFFLTHLSRSLAGQVSRRLEWFCNSFFIVALFEIISGLLLLFTPSAWITAAPGLLTALRGLVFTVFYLYCAGFAGLLVYLSIRTKAANANRNSNESPMKKKGKGPINKKSLLTSTLCLLVALSMPAGCQSLLTGYSTESYDGAAEDVVRMNNNYLGGSFTLPGSLSVYSAQLNLQKTILNPGAPDARRVVSFYGRFFDLEYINIPAGETLKLTIDGRSFQFKGQGSAKLRRPYSDDEGEERVQEAAYWHDVPREVLIAIYRAKTIRIRVRGENRELSFFASDKNRSNFRRFIRDELPDILDAAGR
ncbi:MAG: hypothetical protein NXI24_18480 [bacterium]|nr:hypothetical protein [bacterium]